MRNKGNRRQRRVGQGRSAVVYLDHDAQGGSLGQKVFTGDSASKLVLYLLTGSGNPYTWCESAIRSAAARRRILEHLVKFWFGDKLRLPRTEGWGWNEEHLAFELRTEQVDGCHAPLRSPLKSNQVDYLRDLVDVVMKPLQKHLAEAGFDGLVWQAGRGNPVASNNFMLEESADGRLKWVWIDLESGVPALFAMNPLATLRFYLPKSFEHCRWLFDDVDLPKLRGYLEEHRVPLQRTIGDHSLDEVINQVSVLERFQDDWKSIRRHQRSIAYEFTRGRITEAQSQWYHSRPLRWYPRMLAVTSKRFIKMSGKLGRRGWIWLRSIRLRHVAERVWQYASSAQFRWRVARWQTVKRIRRWAKRGNLDKKEALYLIHELKSDEACEYLTDFSVHIAIKPLIKLLQWWLFPALWVTGLISEVTLGVVLVFAGSVGRTLYTAGRLIQATFRRQRRPWVALWVGLLPVVGDTAYPFQLLYRSAEDTGALARFIVYDIAAAMGRTVPIWGGADSQVEHYFNRGGELLARGMTRLMERGIGRSRG